MKSYNIGLDIGTTSVGWAAVETKTEKVLRKGGKALWGVRLFEEASTAKERRLFRSTRRRYDRRRERINLLQDEFKNEMNKIDPDFFQKMKETFYNQKIDKTNKFIKRTPEERKQIIEYNKKYPTIYHLRYALINEHKKFDIRLVYLAMHHIIKYRGNFLSTAKDFKVNKLDLESSLKNVLKDTVELNGAILIGDEFDDYHELASAIMLSTKNDRRVDMKDLLSPYFNKDFVSEFIKLCNGNKFNFSKMILDESTKVELSFDGSDYDDKYDDYASALGDKIELLDEYKELYNIIFLKRIFKNSSDASLSGLMVNNYKVHHDDLNFLKKILRYDRNEYNKIFRTKDINKLCEYDKYIHNKLSREDFMKIVSASLDKVLGKTGANIYLDEYNDKYKTKIDNMEFLPRITDTENGKYPYQLNKDELIKIIDNQKEFYPFLGEKLEDGTYKIVRLLEFKIPYYVGPLVNDKKSDFAWMIRKDGTSNEKITPYNFDKVIDKSKTAEKFIKRMVGHCTYLLDEEALPNNSILFSTFKVLNELKQITINNHRLSVEEVQKIYINLFLKTPGTITENKFKEYLLSSHDFDMYGTDFEISGYSADKKFANNMSSYVDFFGDNGFFKNTTYTKDDAEKIIEWCTIFEDKDILVDKINKEYDLNPDVVKKIVNKRYKGWGSLSKKLLTDLCIKDKETNTPETIMDLMFETNENFMQIINNEEYNFNKLIAKANNKDKDVNEINYDLVADLATSPSNKRGIYQALKVVDEVIKYIGYEPKYISVEMARDNGEKKRTNDRKNQIKAIYQKNKDIIKDYDRLSEELNGKDKIDSRKLLLYFLQEGKSLYSMTPLDIDHLEQYEIDHILPRSLTTDNSIENTALVLRSENQDKRESLVLPENYRNDTIKKWWYHLGKIGLMSNKKFHNLSRTKFTDRDIEGFISRQLVETRQITKHVANILGNLYKDSKVVYLKANISHNYREKFELYKFRDLNDYHHAHDAYLAAVLGDYKMDYMPTKVSVDILKKVSHIVFEGEERRNYGYVVNSLDPRMYEPLAIASGKKTDFDVNEFNKRVEDSLYRNDILMSKKVEYKTGAFYNETLMKKGVNGVSLKNNLPTDLYGGYSRLNPSYAKMVEFTKKGKLNKRMIGIPIYYIEKDKTDNGSIEKYVRNLLALEETDEVKLDNFKIPFYSLLNWDGQICYLVGASDRVEVVNGLEFKIDKKFHKRYNKSLNKLFNYRDNDRYEVLTYESDLSDIIKYIVDKMEKEYKLFSNLIPELKEIVHYDNIDELELEDKEKICIELFKLLNCRSDNANFKDYGHSSAFGKKNNRMIEECTIISVSPSGIKLSKKDI